MKHNKSNKTADSELYDKLDYYDCSEFDDDYYHDIIEERNNTQSNGKRPHRRTTHYAHAFHDYIKDY